MISLKPYTKRLLRRGAILAGLLTGCILSAAAVSAADAKQGSVTVRTAFETNLGHVQTLSEVKLGLYRVGTIEGDGSWKLLKEYQDSGASLSTQSSTGLADAAKKLERFTRENQLSGEVKSSGADGSVIFSREERGVYLLMQAEAYEMDRMSYRFSPIIFSVPTQVENREAWEFVAEPKFEVTEPGKPTPSEGTPTPSSGTPTPSGGTPTPSGGIPTPSGGTPTPSSVTPTPSDLTPTPSGTTSQPEHPTQQVTPSTPNTDDNVDGDDPDRNKDRTLSNSSDGKRTGRKTNPPSGNNGTKSGRGSSQSPVSRFVNGIKTGDTPEVLILVMLMIAGIGVITVSWYKAKHR